MFVSDVRIDVALEEPRLQLHVVNGLSEPDLFVLAQLALPAKLKRRHHDVFWHLRQRRHIEKILRAQPRPTSVNEQTSNAHEKKQTKKKQRGTLTSWKYHAATTIDVRPRPSIQPIVPIEITAFSDTNPNATIIFFVEKKFSVQTKTKCCFSCLVLLQRSHFK